MCHFTVISCSKQQVFLHLHLLFCNHGWLNNLCKCGGVICDVIYIYKHGTFNKRRQNFNKSIKIRKRMKWINNGVRISVMIIEQKHFM